MIGNVGDETERGRELDGMEQVNFTLDLNVRVIIFTTFINRFGDLRIFEVSCVGILEK